MTPLAPPQAAATLVPPPAVAALAPRLAAAALAPPSAVAALAPRLAVAALALLLAGCAATARPTGARPPASATLEPDSITVGLWRLDETGGTRVADAGPFRLDGTAGLDTRTDFGRVRNARVFSASVESFVFVPHSPAFDEGRGLTLEAWVWVSDLSVNGDAVIAARWTPRLEQQSWLFGVVGRETASSWRASATGAAGPGALAFAFMPQEAGPPRVFFSSARLERARWTHVVVTYDTEVVRFHVDGRPDAQFATGGRLRRTDAPLVIGNLLDPRSLSTFGGDLRATGTIDASTASAFMGSIDELRLSSAARRDVGAGY
jgi:hypothetical protein